ncbi:MAG: histidine phosphatase family protein [Lachnospiraceae bacterium]|nr:histidine phosphatase family protein [Lachnospiraceae bacterium]
MRDWAENQIMLAFIRHGVTQANKERRYLGKTDESLSEEGIEILESYKMQKLYPDVEYLFTSPMKRCTETAKIIYPTLCPIIIPEWEEINFGQFEYRNYEELKDDAEYKEWLSSEGTLDFPEGESSKDFILRCKSGFIRMCNELSQIVGQDANTLVSVGMIVHGGTIMSLLSLYAEKDYFDYQVSNGRGYACRLTGVNDKEAQEEHIQIKVVAEI